MISFQGPVIRHAPQLDVGYAVVEGMQWKKTDSFLSEYRRRVQVKTQSTCSLEELKKVPAVRCFRDLYWLFQMDPTKMRPSAEALARRVLSGGHLPSVDSVVDCVNCVSLNHLLPISCFDKHSLSGSLCVRRAQKSEVFTTLARMEKVLQGGELVVSDTEKIVCLGYASMDAWETRVQPLTQDVILMVYRAPGINLESVSACLREVCDLLIAVNGGCLCQVQIGIREQEEGLLSSEKMRQTG